MLFNFFMFAEQVKQETESLSSYNAVVYMSFKTEGFAWASCKVYTFMKVYMSFMIEGFRLCS